MHWDDVYAGREDNAQSWFEAVPELSLDFITRFAGTDDPVIDVGGGASRLPDALLAAGYGDITVLDLSAAALEVSRARLGAQAARIGWIAADVTSWAPPRTYAFWHDRAVFHFLTDAAGRAGYVRALLAALAPGGTALIATFAPDGPEKCSGLPVVRYSPQSLAAELDRHAPGQFSLVGQQAHRHTTPLGRTQSFQFSVFRRR